MKGIEEKAVYAIWAQVDSKSVDDCETRLDATTRDARATSDGAKPLSLLLNFSLSILNGLYMVKRINKIF